MQRTRFWALVCLGLIGSAASFSCGSEEGNKPPHAGDGGESADAGAASFPVGSAGDGASANGGNAAGGERGSGGPGLAGAGGVENPPDNGGQGGDLGVAGVGGGGPSTVPGEQLELCARLSGLVVHADNVGRAYSNAAYDDCRIKWVIPKGAALYDFRNALVTWSLELWGCQGLPVDTFPLVFETPALSPGDVTLLIAHYMTAAQNELDLSPAEFDEMQAAIERLAAPLISGASTEPSNSQCVAAGAGGAGGAGAAGAGGTGESAAIAGGSGVAGGAP